MVTRRCTQRQLLLRPDRETNNAFLYCLAEAAKRFRIDVIFTLAMSNHHHTGIIDNHGNFPEFLAHFHKLLAKHQNALRGRWENFWSSEQTSAVELVDPEDALAKMIYALTNPVKDHLVERAHHWPGVSSLHALLHGKAPSATRPKRFFRDNGSMPDTVTLSFRRPPGFEHLSESDFRRLVLERIRQAEESAAIERATKGVRLLGRRKVLDQNPFAIPLSREPRRNLKPRVAAQNLWRRIEALSRNKAFLLAYQNARQMFLAGVKVTFPPGTYWLRRFAGATCEDPSDGFRHACSPSPS